MLSEKDDIKSYFHTLLYSAKCPDELIPLAKIQPIWEHPVRVNICEPSIQGIMSFTVDLIIVLNGTNLMTFFIKP